MPRFISYSALATYRGGRFGESRFPTSASMPPSRARILRIGQAESAPPELTPDFSAFISHIAAAFPKLVGRKQCGTSSPRVSCRHTQYRVFRVAQRAKGNKTAKKPNASVPNAGIPCWDIVAGRLLDGPASICGCMRTDGAAWRGRSANEIPSDDASGSDDRAFGTWNFLVPPLPPLPSSPRGGVPMGSRAASGDVDFGDHGTFSVIQPFMIMGGRPRRENECRNPVN